MDHIAEFERRIIVALDKIERHMNSESIAASGVPQSEEMAALTIRNSELLNEVDRLQNELSILRAERVDEVAELEALREDLEGALQGTHSQEGS